MKKHRNRTRRLIRRFGKWSKVSIKASPIIWKQQLLNIKVIIDPSINPKDLEE
jgi:hypothetical protein